MKKQFAIKLTQGLNTIKTAAAKAESSNLLKISGPSSCCQTVMLTNGQAAKPVFSL